MLSALIQTERSYWAMLLAEQLIDQRFVQHGPLVLVSDLLKFLTPTTDRDWTVSRRSEPSSRATLMGEQPNPWDLLQPQDVTSRHRGAKPLRRCELLGVISLLSGVPFILWAMALPCGTTGSLCPSFDPDRLIGLSVTIYRAYTIILYAWLPIMLSTPLEASVTLLEATTPVKLPTMQCLPHEGN